MGLNHTLILAALYDFSNFNVRLAYMPEQLPTFYETTLDPFGFRGEIVHSMTVFDDAEDAVRFFEAVYQGEVELAVENPDWDGTTAEDFLPPQKYLYKSPIANQFEVVYGPTSLMGTVIGYRYQVMARYGNVVSWFVTIVEDENQTGIGSGRANVLPWTETKRLLELIDEKFRRVR